MTFLFKIITMMSLALSVAPAGADALDLARAGFAAKERRQFDVAIRLFDEALRQGGLGKEQLGYVTYSRGVSYEALGIRDKALADLDAAVVLLPNFPNSYLYRGIIWGDKREYDRAIEDFLQAGRLSPKNPMVFNNLGGAYEGKGDIDRAIESFDQAIQLQPNYAEAYYNRANTYLKKPDPERAIADYGQAIWLEPKFAEAYGNRGALYLAKGDTENAVADFTVAIELRPRDVAFRGNRGNAYLTMSKYADALEDFDRAAQIDPGNAGVYLGRGRARLFAKDTVGSIEDFKTALRLRASNPNPVIWLHIARVHNGEADREEFAADAAKVKRDIWPTAVLDFYLGTMNGDQLRAAVPAGPPRDRDKWTCEAEFFVGEFQAHKGDRNEARKILERVVSTCRPHDLIYGAAVAELRLITP